MAAYELPDIVTIGAGRYGTELSKQQTNFGMAHGGYTASVLCNVASFHLKHDQNVELQHTYTFHLEYLKPGRPGPVEIEVKTIRKGSSIATVQVELIQAGTKTVVGYVTNVDLRREGGMTLPAALKFIPPIQSADVKSFDLGGSNDWIPFQFPKIKDTQPSLSHWKWMVPAKGFVDPSVADYWVAWISPEATWTNEWLAALVDQIPQIAENYLPMPNAGINSFTEYAKLCKSGQVKPNEGPVWVSKNWYVTHSLSLEVKRLLPLGQVKWLFCRAQTKEVRNGRQDIEVVVLDPEMSLIAVAHHITLVKDLAWATSAATRGKGSRASTPSSGTKL